MTVLDEPMSVVVEPDAFDDITRREFVIGAGALAGLIVAGCSTDDDGGGGGGAGTVPTSRVLDTPGGVVNVPATPTRVLATYTTGVDYALALQLPLVAGGAKQGTGGTQFASYQSSDALADVTPIDFWPEPNFEQLAATNPDLIIDDTPLNEDWMAVMADITPTLNFSHVVYPVDGGPADWQGALRFLGETFGASDAAESFIARYDARVADVRARVAETIEGQRAIVTTPYAADLFVQTSNTLFIPTLLEDIGVSYPSELADLDPDGAGEVIVPAELYEQLDSDWIIVLWYSDPAGDIDTDLLAPVTTNPLWAQLPAVRAGRVVQLDSDLNFASPGTALQLLEQLEQALLS